MTILGDCKISNKLNFSPRAAFVTNWFQNLLDMEIFKGELCTTRKIRRYSRNEIRNTDKHLSQPG